MIEDDLQIAAICRQRFQHAHKGRDADAEGDQSQGPCMVQGQGEAACWHGRKQGFAHLERSHFARNGAQRLLPDGDAVALAYLQGRSDQGVGTSLRSEEHTSELQSLMRISYAVFCLKKKTNTSN